MAPDRNPLITRLGSNYTILETMQVVEKMVTRGGMDSLRSHCVRLSALRASVEPPTRGFSVFS
jgi:hypothetical protein